MEFIKIVKDYFRDEEIVFAKKKRLFVFLGSFADFDSFEYCQKLSAHSELLEKNLINLIVIGIGSEKSKDNFCKFNKIDSKNVFSVINADLHNQLYLNKGLVTPLPAIINLLIMCAGINSRGTIKEVLRGYYGDKNSNRIFKRYSR